jgi:hypothetical protein
MKKASDEIVGSLNLPWWGMLVSNQRPLECELPNNEKMVADFSAMAATFTI